MNQVEPAPARGRVCPDINGAYDGKIMNNKSSEIDEDEKNRCLSAIMDIGELLLMHGAEVNRVEDTITRLCEAYGFIRSDVFTITSSIVASAMLPDGKTLTLTRRIKERDTDLGKVELVNGLSRKACSAPMELTMLQEEIQKIRNEKRVPVSLKLAMYMLISASLSVFFGGGCRDGFAAALSGAVLFGTLCISSGLKLNSIVQSMACSAVTALSVFFLVRIGIGVQPDKIMIGNIMLVIPGIQLTNSLRDMINGDMISGLLNMSEALLKAIAVAMGFAIVLIFGGA